MVICFKLREQDSDIVAWLEQQPNKSEAIRECMRRGIAAAAASPPAATRDDHLLRTVVREAVREALGDMAITVQPEQPGNGREAGEDPELAARLDSLFDQR
jgi:hypothetical protein